MKQKLFTLLTLALFVCSGAWAADPTITVGTYSTRTIAVGDLTSTWAFNVVSGSAVTLTATTTDNELVYIATSDAKVKMQTSSYASFNKDTEVYIPVPSGSAGSVSVSISSGNDSRYFQLYVNGTEGGTGQRLYSKLNAGGITADGKKGPQTFNFTSSDITTYNTKTYLHFKSPIGEMKVSSFTVTLTTGTYATCTSVAAPTGLACSAHTKNSLTFGWTAASNASSYDVYLYSDAECTQEVTPTEGKPYNVTTTSATLTGLNASKTYYCKVQSKGDGSSYCAEGNVTSAVSGTTDGKDYTVTAASNNNEWGTAAADAGSLDEDETAQITATPESGYKFVSWEVSGTGSELSSTTTNPTTLTMGTADATVTATFRALYTYTITYNKGAYGSGDAIADGEKTEDADFTLSSSKYTRAGYVQTGWSTTDGGDKAYDMGGSYTANANLDLYPFWTELDTQTDIEGYAKWDWSNVSNDSNIDFGDPAPGSLRNVDVLFSNISKYGYTAVSGLDNQTALLMNGQRPYANANGSKHCQVNYLKFTTTVDGIVTVEYANTGSNAARTVNVNGSKGSKSTEANNSYQSETFTVSAGTVTIKGVQVSDDEDKMLRIRKVLFQPTVTATVGAKGYATYCNSDYALDFTGKSIAAYTISSTDGSALTLTQKDKIAKNEPVLLYSSTNSDSQTIPAIADGDASADASNKLKKGDDASHTWVESTAEHYVLATATVEPGFYRANNNTVASTKAYLDLTGLAPEAHAFTLDLGEGNTTGIANISSEKEAMNGAFYNLAGQEVAQPTKGLYIVNGKKVIIK